MATTVIESKIKILGNNDSMEFNKYADIIGKYSHTRLCNKSVSGKYVKQSVEKCNTLFVNVDENDDVRGFATVILDELGIYIDVICSSAIYHPMIRRSGEFLHYSGKHIIEYVKDYAIENKIEYIHLSALENVITYYYKLGFRFFGSDGDLNEELSRRESKLMTDLRESEDITQMEKTLNKVIIRKYPGYLSEKTQSSISGDENRTLFARDAGVPMILKLEIPKTPSSKGLKKHTRSSSRGGNKKTRKRKYKKTK